MNLFKKKYNLICLLCLCVNSTIVIADRCPSAETVKERKISREYEWTIDERRSLEDVLSVEKLYSVRIKNKGEFVACYYTGKNLLRLDAKAIKEGCLISVVSGSWKSSGNGEQICDGDDLNLCLYEINCAGSEENTN